MKTPKDMLVIGIGLGFQHLLDSYFWYLPFASVRQCKFVLERAKLLDDEWMTKRAALAEEHTRPGAQDSLKAGFKDWLRSEHYKQSRAKLTPVPSSTQTVILDD